jgi:hypothetical protein
MTLHVQPRIAPQPTPASVGYVIYDSEETAIYGAGATVDDAWRQVMDLCDRPVNAYTGEPISEDEWFAQFRVKGASAALLEQVASTGGDIAWGYLAGVACTVGELVDYAWEDA